MDEINKFLKMAKDDFESSQSNFQNKKYYVCAFLSQQSAEKSLKAVLLKKSESLIKVHDLILLGKKVNLPESLLDKCKLLSQMYTETIDNFDD